ncbi:MAG: uracil-DNA glycosylase [Herminiimonas sp.]|nr:uracil-DNA glycosylase [Herminiimonas sp.]
MNADLPRRAVFLAEMGIGPLWIHRSSPLATVDAAVLEAAPVSPSSAPAEIAPPVVDAAIAVQTVLSAWDDNAAGAPPSRIPAPSPAVLTELDIAAMDWSELKTAVAGCTRCGLCTTRTRTVFGTGDQKAKWLFVGEGPGRNEDLQGEPFVGPAGKLLDNMLLATGIKRDENAYIANIVKCRPTDANGRDRAPTSEEAATCLPYLERQIALIQPAIIVALGKTAALSLLKLPPATPVSKLRGVVHRFADLPLVVTYHPAYLLRSLTEKRKSWEDLCLAMETYAGET